MNKNVAKGNSSLIIIAIIGALSTILVASIGAMTTYNAEKMRQESELTQIALVSTATQAGITQAALLKTVNAPTELPAPTYTLYPTLTPYPTLMPLPTLTSIPTPVATTQINILETESVVDGYLTAIENKDWAVAYDYLCPAIKETILSPEDMASFIFNEMGYNSLPTSHKFLSSPDDPNRVWFSLSGISWSGGPYEARVDEISSKVCGAGLANGDLRHLLLPGGTLLDIAP